MPVRYRTLAVRDGEFYVSVAELVVATPLDELRVRAEVAYAEEWLTLEQAVDYSHLSVATVERLEHDGTLRRGGTTGRPLYKRKWLDAALGAVPLLVVAVLLAVTSLLLAELVDVVLPGPDFGFPPGTGHPLSHPLETARDLAVALERLLDGG